MEIQVKEAIQVDTLKKPSAFLNFTAHDLTDDQKKEAVGIYDVERLDNLKDINKYLFDKLVNQTKFDYFTFSELVMSATNFIQEWVCDRIEERYRRVYIHLPIGHPAFMFYLSKNLFDFQKQINKEEPILQFLFSGSKRIVEEVKNPDGTVSKKTTFRFEGFIGII